MQKLGNVEDKEMFRTFNMGIGMVVICSSEDADAIKLYLGVCYEIGRVDEGNGTVSLI